MGIGEVVVDPIGGLVYEGDGREQRLDAEGIHLPRDHGNYAGEILRAAHLHGGDAHPLDGQLTLGTGQIDPCRFLAFEVLLLDELGLRFSGVLQHGSHLLCC